MITQILATFCFGVFIGFWFLNFLVIKKIESEVELAQAMGGFIFAGLLYVMIMFVTPTTYINVCDTYEGITVDPAIIDFANCHNNQKEK